MQIKQDEKVSAHVRSDKCSRSADKSSFVVHIFYQWWKKEKKGIKVKWMQLTLALLCMMHQRFPIGPEVDKSEWDEVWCHRLIYIRAFKISVSLTSSHLLRLGESTSLPLSECIISTQSHHHEMHHPIISVTHSSCKF